MVQVIVPFVKETESEPPVIVQMVPSNVIGILTSISVQIVINNVLPVLKKKIYVTDVLKTEFMFQFVLAQWVNMKFKTKLIVQNVIINVDLVYLLLTTVSNVLKD